MIDDDLPILDIRCGSDIRDTLAAGFVGDFLEFSDLLCEGPVPNTPDPTAVRARYLAESEAYFATSLRDAGRHLTEAARDDRVLLWSASSGPIPTATSLWSNEAARTTAASAKIRPPRPSDWIH